MNLMNLMKLNEQALKCKAISKYISQIHFLL
jgi:hypothetical protein